MLDDRLAADVDDKRDLRPDFGDIGKILLGTHPNIRAAGNAEFLEPAKNVEIGSLVRSEIVRMKKAARLRKIPNDSRKFGSRNGVIVNRDRLWTLSAGCTLIPAHRGGRGHHSQEQ